MDHLESNASRLRFEAYVDALASVIGHADRTVPLHDYCTGLLLPGERKSVEPMAALTVSMAARNSPESPGENSPLHSASVTSKLPTALGGRPRRFGSVIADADGGWISALDRMCSGTRPACWRIR